MKSMREALKDAKEYSISISLSKEFEGLTAEQRREIARKAFIQLGAYDPKIVESRKRSACHW